MFKGYKTYVVGALAIIGAIATYLIGDASLPDTIEIVITAILGMTIRAGITTDVKKVETKVTDTQVAVAEVHETTVPNSTAAADLAVKTELEKK